MDQETGASILPEESMSTALPLAGSGNGPPPGLRAVRKLLIIIAA
jgi:hypothetical protein